MSYDVMQFGAMGDGITNDAPAIQKAIDECTKTGGRVVLPSGKTFYASSIVLKSNVELYLEKGSVLKAHSDLDTYLNPNNEPVDYDADIIDAGVVQKPPYAFIYAKDADNISIAGQGVIDGNAYAFVERWSQYYVNSELYPRPTLIYVEHCNHITFRDVTMRKAPFWTLHPAGCDDVLIKDIRILNDLDMANSDGIDPDHCSNVRISGCHITCGDDCICMKATIGNMKYGPTENVIVSDCTLISTSAAIKIGTEGTGDFRNILIQDCIVSRSNRGISVQIRDQGNVENVSFRNIMIETRRFADSWWGCAEPIAISVHDRDENTKSGKISNVRFSNITCDSENGVFVSGTEENMVEDIVFENVQVRMSAKSKWERGMYDLRPGYNKGIEKRQSPGFYIRCADGVKVKNCRVRFCGEDKSDFAQAFYAENGKNITLEQFDGKAASEQFKDVEIL